MRDYIKLIFAIGLIGSLVISCNQPKQEEGKTPLARVHDKFLYLEDIAEMIPNNIPPQDSINKVKSFVDFWVREQALTKTAEINLPEEQKNVASELEKYRMTLLIERYKRKFLAQNLDTVVTSKQISDFYNEHEAEFKLSQSAVKATYIKILRTTPNMGLVRSLYRSDREKDKQELKSYCAEHAAMYDEFNNDWIYFKDLMIEIPLRIDNQENYLKSRDYIEVEDSVYNYLVNIHNYRLIGATSPLVFVEGNIQSMMLNQRKQQLIDNLQTNIYNNMIDKNEIEIFENQ
ncbi:MAG: hypothetical protein HC831_20360 [Chloroflexia bacterium]|nr:hypothetical protein [Chloroflexia bacterium]